MILAGAFAVLALSAGQENRLWFVELELRGSCEGVRLDCGPDGATLLRGPFGSGEDRRIPVPVPARSPLGREGLAALPLPRVELLPSGATAPSGPAAQARVLGWSERQPSESLRAAEPLHARVRPPAAAGRVRARAVELLVAIAAGGFLVALRKRPWSCALLAGASGLVVFLLARSRASEPVVGEVVQWRAGEESALRIRGAGHSLPLSGAALEVSPEGAPIRIEWEARGGGTARVESGHLYTLALAAPPDLARGRNGAGLLAEVWTRAPNGAWSAHGRWGPGEPLGARADGVPPGWISAALPPGIGVLVARESAGTWLRCLGFAPE